MTKRLGAEFLGTAWLVFGGCGSAVLAAAFPELGIGFVGVSLAFGLTVLTMAYAIGHISGGHFNPAVSVGLWAGGRFPASEILPVRRGPGAGRRSAAAVVLYVIASGKAGFDLVQSGFAANGFGEHSPGGYSLVRGFVAEVVLTFFFLLVILGATDRRAPAGFAPIAIGLAPDAHPPDRHPGDQHVGQPGAQHRRRRSSSAAGRSRSCGCSGWRRSSAPRRRVPSTAGSPRPTASEGVAPATETLLLVLKLSVVALSSSVFGWYLK